VQAKAGGRDSREKSRNAAKFIRGRGAWGVQELVFTDSGVAEKKRGPGGRKKVGEEPSKGKNQKARRKKRKGKVGESGELMFKGYN